VGGAMICKTVEIRDRATFILALAVRLIPDTAQDRYLLGRAGYGSTPERQGDYVLLMRLAGGNGLATWDPYHWDTRTMQAAHLWLLGHFDELESGGVVDVEYLAGETATRKRSEAETV
jgi:hypothetical protein